MVVDGRRGEPAERVPATKTTAAAAAGERKRDDGRGEQWIPGGGE